MGLFSHKVQREFALTAVTGGLLAGMSNANLNAASFPSASSGTVRPLIRAMGAQPEQKVWYSKPRALCDNTDLSLMGNENQATSVGFSRTGAFAATGDELRIQVAPGASRFILDRSRHIIQADRSGLMDPARPLLRMSDYFIGALVSSEKAVGVNPSTSALAAICCRLKWG